MEIVGPTKTVRDRFRKHANCREIRYNRDPHMMMFSERVILYGLPCHMGF